MPNPTAFTGCFRLTWGIHGNIELMACFLCSSPHLWRTAWPGFGVKEFNGLLPLQTAAIPLQYMKLLPLLDTQQVSILSLM